MDIALNKNDIYEAEISGFTSEGLGVCRVSGRAVFVPRALPGELWRVRIVKVTSTAVYGRGEALLSPSPSRVEPECPHFGRCGGCALMHMSYDRELEMKLSRVNEAFRRIADWSCGQTPSSPPPARFATGTRPFLPLGTAGAVRNLASTAAAATSWWPLTTACCRAGRPLSAPARSAISCGMRAWRPMTPSAAAEP